MATPLFFAMIKLMTNIDSQKIKELLSRGVEEVINRKHLEKRLLSGEKLRIKFGVDPTKPDIHLGHIIPLRKLKEFQKLGHIVVFIVGDFTAQIGDPSGRSKTRPQLSAEKVRENAKTYLEQAEKVIDIKKIEVRKNSEWYGKMKPDDFMRLFSKITLTRILERDDFQKRIKANRDIYPHEIIYPLLQAYDSIVVKADVEIGGTDQTFNMLMARILQKRFNQPIQDVVTVPLLIGTDGKQKMSKSFDNYIGIIESPQGQYGKIMSIPDGLIIHYFELLSDVPIKEINRMGKDLALKKVNPKDLKSRLAKELVTIYHNRKIAEKAEKDFNKVFKEKGLPSEIPGIKIKENRLPILELLMKTKLVPSKSEAKRLIIQKGVKINGRTLEDWAGNIEIKKGMLIQIGKRKFIKVR